MSDDPKIAAVVTAIERAVLAAVQPLHARLQTVETAAAGLTPAAPVPGPVGPPGPPGADGAGVDKVAVEYDGERGVTFTVKRGGTTVDTFAYTLPLMIYRGVHVPGRLYERGDCVTADGSVFHCNADTTTAPGNAAGAWTLAVKRGKDAR
jgi:hypothetical protein